MSKYTLDDVKQLRSETGARVLDCKKALEEAGGDLEKAKQIVAEKDLARAEKKQDRATTAGYVAAYVHNTGKVAAMVEMQCETDFVAKNEEFRQMVYDLAMQVAAMNPEDKKALLKQDFIKDPSVKVETYIKSVSGKIGENMVLARFKRFEVGVETE